MILVTGGSGLAGRAAIAELLAHGHDVLSADMTPPPADQGCPFVRADLTDYGQTLALLSGVDEVEGEIDAIVHLAAVPGPGRTPNHVAFHTNVLSTYNVFEAARQRGIRNIVFASSETVLGVPFDTPPPYLPADEEFQPAPESAYALSKYVGEVLARDYVRRDAALKIACLRISNIMTPTAYAKRFPGFNADPAMRRINLWGYVDSRDVAQAIRLAVEARFKGFEAFVIAAADTVMSLSNEELLAAEFPTVSARRATGAHETLLSIDKARRLLGYSPRYSWRDEPPAA